jgi:4-alpha-glucanotransferase
MNKRSSGILLHISSLSSPCGIGDLGPAAYRFVDFLAETRQQLWQILPLNPTDLAHANSPYHSSSAFACNALLISPEILVTEGLLDPEALMETASFPREKVDFPAIVSFKKIVLEKAYHNFKRSHPQGEFLQFCSAQGHWLQDFALFMALKSHFQGRVWTDWPPEIRDRRPELLEELRQKLLPEIEKHCFQQWLFFKQWFNLKNYCRSKGVRIIGDIPIYLIHDSVDIWIHPHLVKLDQEKRPLAVAGVPPDYFSATGQYWGNPVYDWDQLRQTHYAWWVQRAKHNLALFDFVRIDHFRGFVAYWEIPATEKNAVHGKWVKAPVDEFLQTILKEIPGNAIIAEDLGFITQDVKDVIQRFNLPGMKILLFAFGSDLPTNPYVPHNHIPHCIVYTGTHDNNTIRGWFEHELSPEDRRRLFQYLGHETPAHEIHLTLIRLAMMSVANWVVFPIQDLLGLGQESRMNKPAVTEGNWQWRLQENQITPELRQKLREMTEIYGRAR